jgi:hypothetical protein
MRTWFLEDDLTGDGIPDRLVRIHPTDSTNLRDIEDEKDGPEGLLLYKGLANGRDSLIWASDLALPWIGCECSYLRCQVTLTTGKKSLFIRSGGASSFSNLFETVQYRFEDGEFLAIGRTIRGETSQEDGTSVEESLDHNLLTGRTLETTVVIDTGRRTVKKGRKPLRPKESLRNRFHPCVDSSSSR